MTAGLRAAIDARLHPWTASISIFTREGSWRGPAREPRADAGVTALFEQHDREAWRNVSRDRGVRQLVVLEQGLAVAETEQGLWPMAAGSILSIPPGAPCAVRFSRCAAGRVVRAGERTLVTTVALVLPEPAPDLWRAHLHAVVVRFWEGRAKRDAREQMFRELDAVCKYLGPGFEGVVVGYLLVILFRWLDRAPSGPQADRTMHRDDRWLVALFRNMVEQTFADRLAIGAYGEALGVSKSRLTRACAAVARRSPLEIVHDRILLEAQRELTYSDASTTEIAAALGFGKSSYFVRFFSQRMGVTPMRFRADERESAQRHAKTARRSPVRIDTYTGDDSFTASAARRSR